MLCERMPWWIVAAALGSIALTALLTFILWRINAPGPGDSNPGTGDASAGAPIIVAGAAHDDGAGNSQGTGDGGSEGGGGGGK
jgi:hypothetical protein